MPIYEDPQLDSEDTQPVDPVDARLYALEASQRALTDGDSVRLDADQSTSSLRERQRMADEFTARRLRLEIAEYRALRRATAEPDFDAPQRHWREQQAIAPSEPDSRAPARRSLYARFLDACAAFLCVLRDEAA